MSDRIQPGDRVCVQMIKNGLRDPYIRGCTYIGRPAGVGDTFKFLDPEGVPFEVNGNSVEFVALWKEEDPTDD